MRREHYKQLIDNGLIFHAPLTTDSTDIIGGKTSVVEAVSYSSDGAYFDTTNKYKYLAYQLTESEFKSVKTIYAEFYRTTSKYSTETVYVLGGVVGPLYDYSRNYEGVIRNYRDIWHDLDCMSAKYSATQISDWRYDFDANSNTSVSTNTWHKCVSCTYSTRQFLYLDGTKDFERNNTDTFQNYDFTTKNHTGLYLFVGGRVQQNEKMFEGHIRNVMMFNKEFTDAELAAMTSLT